MLIVDKWTPIKKMQFFNPPNMTPIKCPDFAETQQKLAQGIKLYTCVVVA